MLLVKEDENIHDTSFANVFEWYTVEYLKSHLCFLGTHTKNTVASTIKCVVHDGKHGSNTIKYTMAFLYSDWLALCIFYCMA